MKNIILILAFSLGLSSCSYAQRFNNPEANKINFALSLIENMYVDTINKKKFTDEIITNTLQKLDPHSGYLTPEEIKEMNEPLQGNFDGIGIMFNMLTDTLYVVQVIPGGPSERVGIIPGDRIMFVNDTLISGVKMSTTDAMSRLKGPKGTEVELKVLRGNNSDLLPFKIKRDKIPVYSLDASYMINNKTGYIKLNRFGATTYEEFMEAMIKLKKEGLENLILDLQDNGGGYMGAAIQIANEFLNSGDLIVYTEGENSRRSEYKARKKGDFIKNKLVVIVNESSASASEILAGAVQDWDRGVVVGRRTYGKGLVQQVFEYNVDHSAIKLTIARYYTPTGRSVQKPYENGNIESYNMDIINRYNRGEMLSADSIHFPDSLKYNTLVNNRVVYGGGGIMPDFFVPMDTSRFTDIHRGIIASGTLNKYVINYVDNNRDKLKSLYPNIDNYKTKFTVSDKMLNDLLEMFKNENFEFHKTNKSVKLTPEEIQELQNNNYVMSDEFIKKVSASMKENKSDKVVLSDSDLKDFNKAKPLIQIQVKALIARDIWTANDYFYIINDNDESLKKAIEIISNEKEYNKLLNK
ncbi:carboxyl-terminal processing protease [Dysgonomonadaceae bacterium PH5-43]|nr:carboxyl-terminal processing protease [Dysgonomonadaceae bacterium PH5-43]